MRSKVLFIVLIIIIIYLAADSAIEQSKYGLVKSSVDSQFYRVNKTFPNYKPAANYLAKRNLKTIKFLRYLKEKYRSTPRDNKMSDIVANILHNYNFEVISENNPTSDKNTAYTVDKGKELYICIRVGGHSKKFIDPDLADFIILHEIAHMGSNTWGHQEEFWTTFKFVLHEAKLSGMYKIIDYKLFPQDYCSLYVDYNPYFDNTLRSIWN